MRCGTPIKNQHLFSPISHFFEAMIPHQPLQPGREKNSQAAAAQMKLDQAKTVSSAACKVSSLCDLASSKAPDFFTVSREKAKQLLVFTLPETNSSPPWKGTILEGISTSNHQFSGKNVSFREGNFCWIGNQRVVEARWLGSKTKRWGTTENR